MTPADLRVSPEKLRELAARNSWDCVIDGIAVWQDALRRAADYIEKLERVAEAARTPSLRWNEEYCSREECEYMTADWKRLDDALANLT